MVSSKKNSRSEKSGGSQVPKPLTTDPSEVSRADEQSVATEAVSSHEESSVKSFIKRPLSPPEWNSEEIQAANLLQDGFTCCTVLVMEDSPEFSKYSELLSQAVVNGTRRKFSCLTGSDVGERVKRFMENNELPTDDYTARQDLYAEAVKTSLLQFRDLAAEIKREDDHLKSLELSGVRSKDLVRYVEPVLFTLHGSTALVDETKRRSGDAKKKDKWEPPPAPPPTGAMGQNKVPPGPVNLKKEKSAIKLGVKTRMRKRGEAAPLENSNEDDAPTEGPGHFVLLLGFYNPRLITELEAIGVKLDGIFLLTDMEINRYNFSILDVEDSIPGTFKPNNILPRCHTVLKALAENPETQTSEVAQFWIELCEMYNSATEDSTFHDIALMNVPMPDSKKLDLERDEGMTCYVNRVYDQVAQRLYQMLACKDMFQKFNNLAVKVTNLQPVDQSLPMTIYNQIVSQVPSECMSVSVLLDAVVQQVVHTVDNKQPNCAPMGSVLSRKYEFGTIPWNSDNNPESSKTKSRQKQSKMKVPLYIKSGDFASIRTSHLEESLAAKLAGCQLSGDIRNIQDYLYTKIPDFDRDMYRKLLANLNHFMYFMPPDMVQYEDMFHVLHLLMAAGVELYLQKTAQEIHTSKPRKFLVDSLPDTDGGPLTELTQAGPLESKAPTKSLDFLSSSLFTVAEQHKALQEETGDDPSVEKSGDESPDALHDQHSTRRSRSHSRRRSSGRSRKSEDQPLDPDKAARVSALGAIQNAAKLAVLEADAINKAEGLVLESRKRKHGKSKNHAAGDHKGESRMPSASQLKSEPVTASAVDTDASLSHFGSSSALSEWGLKPYIACEEQLFTSLNDPEVLYALLECPTLLAMSEASPFDISSWMEKYLLSAGLDNSFGGILLGGLQNWNYVEELVPIQTVQMLNDCCLKYLSVQRVYCPFYDTILFIFNNPIPEDLTAEDQFYTRLHTQPGFQHFLEYTMDDKDVQSWISQLETPKRRSAQEETLEQLLETIPEDQWLMEPSIKYELFLQNKLIFDNGTIRNLTGTGTSSSGSYSRKTSKGMNEEDITSNTTSDQEPPTSLSNNSKGTGTTTSSQRRRRFSFKCYDLGKKEPVLGSDTFFMFPMDGTVIRYDVNSIEPESRMMQLSISKNGHSSYFYPYFVPKEFDLRAESFVVCPYFHMMLENGTVFAFQDLRTEESPAYLKEKHKEMSVLIEETFGFEKVYFGREVEKRLQDIVRELELEEEEARELTRESSIGSKGSGGSSKGEHEEGKPSRKKKKKPGSHDSGKRRGTRKKSDTEQEEAEEPVGKKKGKKGKEKKKPEEKEKKKPEEKTKKKEKKEKKKGKGKSPAPNEQEEESQNESEAEEIFGENFYSEGEEGFEGSVPETPDAPPPTGVGDGGIGDVEGEWMYPSSENSEDEGGEKRKFYYKPAWDDAVKVIEPLTHTVTATLPSGLTMTVEDVEGPPLHRAVKQFYVGQGSSKPEGESSRYYTMDGTVIKFMSDKSIQVLTARGVTTMIYELAANTRRDGDMSFNFGGASIVKIFNGEVILPSGHVYRVFNGKKQSKPPIYLFNTSLLPGGESFSRRQDGVIFLRRYDGTIITHYPDGTRFTAKMIVIESACERPKKSESSPENNYPEYAGESPPTSPRGSKNEDEPEEVTPEERRASDAPKRESVTPEEPTSPPNEEENPDNEEESEELPPAEPEPGPCDEAFLDEEFSDWVFVGIKYMIEHPNYSAVLFNTLSGNCHVKLPYGEWIRVYATGTVHVSTHDNYTLEVDSVKALLSYPPCSKGPEAPPNLTSVRLWHQGKPDFGCTSLEANASEESTETVPEEEDGVIPVNPEDSSQEEVQEQKKMSLPDPNDLKIKPRESYKSQTNLTCQALIGPEKKLLQKPGVQQETVVITSKFNRMTTRRKSGRESIEDFLQFKEEVALCKATDSWENRFSLDIYGNSFVEKVEEPGVHEMTAEHVVEALSEHSNLPKDYLNGILKFTSSANLSAAAKRMETLRSQYKASCSQFPKTRVFAVKRNLSGYEYLQENQVESVIQEANASRESMVITDPLPNRDPRKFVTIMRPVGEVKSPHGMWARRYIEPVLRRIKRPVGVVPVIPNELRWFSNVLRTAHLKRPGFVPSPLDLFRSKRLAALEENPRTSTSSTKGAEEEVEEVPPPPKDAKAEDKKKKKEKEAKGKKVKDKKSKSGVNQDTDEEEVEQPAGSLSKEALGGETIIKKPNKLIELEEVPGYPSEIEDIQGIYLPESKSQIIPCNKRTAVVVRAFVEIPRIDEKMQRALLAASMSYAGTADPPTQAAGTSSEGKGEASTTQESPNEA